MARLKRGDKVRKSGGDYSFTGRVAQWVKKFPRKKEQRVEWRVVVQDSRGLLLIMHPRLLKRIS